MRKAYFSSITWVLCLFFLISLGYCIPPQAKRPKPKPKPNAKADAIAEILKRRGVFAEDSLYACLLNLYYQGIPLNQARDECATKLYEDDQKGFEGPMGKIGPGSEQFFDPYKVSAACGAGDPRLGQSSSGYASWPGRGQYTWGGDPKNYYGYAKEDSYKMKEEAVKEAEKANKEFYEAEEKDEAAKKALDAAKKSGDKEAEKKAQEEYERLHQEALKKAAEAVQKNQKAQADPNKKPQGNTRTVEGETPCEQALQAAREILRECERTRWQSTECQQLQAKMNHCPDPTLIHVDPDQGYACGGKIDAEALKNAWVAHCEELKRFGPGGDNPCVPPKVDNPGRYIKDKKFDPCKGDPRIYTDPGSSTCQTEIQIQPYGEPDIHQIVVFGLNKLGGPTVVIPVKDPKPPPGGGGPEPRPGPKD